jgi:hypothetical protein
MVLLVQRSAAQHDRRGDGGSTWGREGSTREGALGGDGCRKEEEACMFLENTHLGDEEDRPNCHDYRHYGYRSHGNS